MPAADPSAAQQLTIPTRAHTDGHARLELALVLFGSLREGRITVKLSGATIADFVGNFDKRVILQPGTHAMTLTMQEATGDFNYALE